MTRNLEPIRDRILLKEIKKEESPGGIKLPQNRYSTFSEGEVVAVGPGLVTVEGKEVKPQVDVGDIVLYAAEGPGVMQIDFGGNDYVILIDDSFVLGKIKEGETE